VAPANRLESRLLPLQRERTRAGLTLRQLAAKSKVHLTRLHYAEHGLVLREDELLRVAAVLHCSPEALSPRVTS
jgi:hypothetical protein